jgi:hypothetical protein
MRKYKLTEEEKVATKLYAIVNEIDLDLDKVGFYFARLSRKLHFNRFEIIYESAKDEKDKADSKMSEGNGIV